jgi:hypothetical protein
MATAKQRAARRPSKKSAKKKVAQPDVATTPEVTTPAKSVKPTPKHTLASPVRGKLPSAWQISQKTAALLWRNKKLFLGISGIYLILNIILVRGFSGATDLTPLRDLITGTYPGGVGQFTSSFSLFAILITATGNTSSDVAGAYQTMLLIIASLAIIWTLRQTMAGEKKIRIRDSFYKGMYPLIPVLLVLVVMLVQLIPLIICGYVYGLVMGNGIAVYPIEKILWTLMLLVGFAISIYFVSSSVFAIYIATLVDMTPVKALRTARDLVKRRRLSILRKFLFLPIALLFVSAVIMIPIILVLTPLAPWVFFLLTMVGLVVIHAYMYTLYRELIV